MNEVELLTRLAVALAIGLLAGLERGWQLREEEQGQRVAGLRTFAIAGLLGGIAAAVSLKSDAVVLGLMFVGYGAAMTVFYGIEAITTHKLSVTSLVASLLTFALGAYAVLGELQVAIAGGIAMSLLLVLREPLHRWIATLSWEEIRAVLILLAMTFLLLPLLPDRPVDPWGALNPHDIWLFAILIAAVSFAGYVAVRLFGSRLGVVTAAIAGGLASSTATTLTLARLGRERPQSALLIAAGILIAGVVMVLRVGAVASLLNPALLIHLAPPLGAAALVLAGGAGVFLLRKSAPENLDLKIGNPLQLRGALEFAAFITILLLVTKAVGNLAGGAGAIAIAAISGLVDVDAVTVSMARSDAIPAETAVLAILTVVAVNTLAKAAMAGWAGGPRIGAYVGAVSVLALAAGAAVALFLH